MISLIYIVYLGKKRSIISQYFSLMGITTLIWVNFGFLARLKHIENISLLGLRLAWSVTPFVVIFLYFFVIEFVHIPISQFMKKIVRALLYITGIILLIVTLTTNFVIQTIVFDQQDILHIVYGEYVIPYFLFIFVLAITILSLVFTAIFRAKERIEKKRLGIILLGFLLFLIPNIIFNIILPYFLGIVDLYEFGDYSTIFLLLALTYSIIKFKFLNFKLILKKLIYIYIITGGTYTYFLLNYYVLQNIFETQFGFQTILFSIVITLIYIFIFFNTKELLRHKFNLINTDPTAKNYNLTLQNLSYKVAKNLNLEDVIQHTFTTINNSINPQYIFLRIRFQQDAIGYNFTSNINKIKNLNEICKTVKDIKQPILYESLLLDDYNLSKQISHKIKGLMKNNSISILLPIVNTNEGVQGILLLGKPKIKKQFLSTDLEFIKNIANIITPAIERALLYQEVRAFNDTLQNKIRKATKSLKQKNIILQETLRRERELLDILGHELRTPLTIGKNAVMFLEEQLQNHNLDNEKLKKYLAIANENLKREATLVETLLSTTKIDNKSLDLLFEKIDIIDVVNDSFELMRKKAKKKKLKLEFEYKDKVFAYADRNRTQEIIDNLIDNAIKYTIKGWVKVTAYTKGKNIYVEVKDTGVGISKEDLKKLGQKFFRTNTYVKSSQHKKDYQIVRPGGTGLGLYVTFNLAKAMDGEVTVQSELEKGSTFTLRLPKYSNQKSKKTGRTETIFEKFERLKKAKATKGKEKKTDKK